MATQFFAKEGQTVIAKKDFGSFKQGQSIQAGSLIDGGQFFNSDVFTLDTGTTQQLGGSGGITLDASQPVSQEIQQRYAPSLPSEPQPTQQVQTPQTQTMPAVVAPPSSEQQGGLLSLGLDLSIPNQITPDDAQKALSGFNFLGELQGLVGQRDEFRDRLTSLLQDNGQVQQLRSQLNDVREKAKNIELSAQAGIDKVSGEAIPMPFITGQSAEIAKQATREVQALAAQEANLLADIGLIQEAKQAEIDVLQTGLSYIQNDIDLAFKIDQTLQAKEEMAFNRARQLRQDAQGMLGIIMGSLEGVRFGQIAPEDQQQILALAQQAGIPADVLVNSLDVAAQRFDFEMIKSQAELQKMLSPDSTPTTKVVGNTLLQFDPMSQSWYPAFTDYSSSYGVPGTPGQPSSPALTWAQAISNGKATLSQITGDGSEQLRTETLNVLNSLPPTQEQVTQLQRKINDIESLQDHPGLSAAVGAGPLNRGFTNLYRVATGDQAAFLGLVDNLLSNKALDELVDRKNSGATFGALSDAELRILQQSATALGAYAIRDENGRLKGFNVNEGVFKEELNKIINSYKALLPQGYNSPDEWLDSLGTEQSGYNNEINNYIQNQIYNYNSGFNNDLSMSQNGSVQIPQSARLAYVNNNPGNLRFVGQAGAVQGEGGFARFASPQAGYQALLNQIQLDASRGLTLQEFIYKYAPPSENDSRLYLQQVQQATGATPQTPISQINRDALGRAIAKKESSTIIG